MQGKDKYIFKSSDFNKIFFILKIPYRIRHHFKAIRQTVENY